MTWQTQNLSVFARTKLRPEEFAYFGFKQADTPKSNTAPQNSDIYLREDDWRYGALPFIRALEAAKMKLTA